MIAAAIYGASLLLRLDAIQQRVAQRITKALQELCDTPIEIGSVQVQHLDKVLIKELYITDLEGDTAVAILRITAHISPLHLLNGNIRVNTLMLGSPSIKLYRTHRNSPLNIQFLLDRLAGDNTEKKGSIPNLRINQLQIYEGTLRYDIKQEERKERTHFDPSHIAVEAFTANLSLKKLNSDTLNLNIRSISAKESSGFTLNRLSAGINATADETRIENLLVELPGSNIESKILTIGTKEKKKPVMNGTIHATTLTLSDFAAFLPRLETKGVPLLSIKADVAGNTRNTNGEITITTNDKSLALQLGATTDNILFPQESNFAIKECRLYPTTIGHIQTLICDSTGKLNALKRVGNITIEGKATSDSNGTLGTLSAFSDGGNLLCNISVDKAKACNATLLIENIKLGEITENKDINTCDIDAEVQGCINAANPDITFSTTISSLEYRNYLYSPININGTYSQDGFTANIAIDDPNASGYFTCTSAHKERKEIKITLDIDSIKPDNLNIGNGENGTLSATAAGSYSEFDNGKSLLDLRFYNILQQQGKRNKNIRLLHIVDNNLLENRNLLINSDILDAKIAGQFDYASLIGTFNKIIHTHTPALAPARQPQYANNAYVFNIDIKNTATISNLLSLPVTIHERSSITGLCDDNRKLFHATIKLNNTDIDGRKFRHIDTGIFANDSTTTLRSTLRIPQVTGKKVLYAQHGNDLIFNINASAHENIIKTALQWKRDSLLTDKGDINLSIALAKHNNDLEINTNIAPGEIIYNSTSWKVSECNIKYSKEGTSIDNLHLSNKEKHLTARGKFGKAEEDIFDIHLSDIKLETILDIVNFHSVEFGGDATGDITISSALAEPQFDSKLHVKNFTFEEGYLGELDFAANWNDEQKAVLIRGDIYDTGNAHSVVHGLVSPANDTINLCIDADRTRLAFLNSMLEGIISDVTATATGQIYVIGRLGSPNLEGKAKAEGAMRVVATNGTYTMLGDTVRLYRNKIAMDKVKIADDYGHTGYIDGSIDHKDLGNFTCDLDITADNLLAYHSAYFNGNPFYGTTFVTGNANITANSKGLFIHADVRSDKNSTFVYDASSIGSVSSNSFIKFTDRNKVNIATMRGDGDDYPTNATKSLLSRLNLEFMIDVTPDIQLKVFTNLRTGDYIDIYGKGPITAVYDEKEGFTMKGDLDVERGTYKFTMQDIFPKEFSIMEGSKLGFNGDPFGADLNLKTKYLVPSTSLSDLDPSGRRHKNVRVNCLMDITGKLDSPQLSFDIELPDANEEERELLASAINTPEQKNMQFVYLMGIGKFYTYDYNRSEGSSESSSAMESLISNTISGQLNNMLSQIIDNRNWNISGNFSSSERGWNSMEVEGILEGRLLDNRLLINGNFGYRENPLANSNFVGDFEIQYLLDKNGNISLKAYNKTNDRYFSESSLTTQGAGVILRHDFNDWRWWLKNNKKKAEKAETEK